MRFRLFLRTSTPSDLLGKPLSGSMFHSLDDGSPSRPERLSECESPELASGRDHPLREHREMAQAPERPAQSDLLGDIQRRIKSTSSLESCPRAKQEASKGDPENS